MISDLDIEIREQIAANFKAILKSQDITIHEFARRCTDEPQNNLYRLARGKHTPHITTIVRVARDLGVTLDDLCGPAKKKKKVG